MPTPPVSYAQVAAHNAPPPSQQPHADPALLYTKEDAAEAQHSINELPDVTTKVTIVPQGWDEHPQTQTSAAAQESSTDDEDDGPHNVNGSAKRKARKQRARKEKERLKREARSVWETTKHVILRPGVAGGFLTVVNVGILGSLGYHVYSTPSARTDRQFLSLSTVGLLGLFAAEGYAADKYFDTPQGKQVEQEGLSLLRHSQEIILRPSVFGGLLGAANVVVLGSLGWFAYSHWDYPDIWTRKNINIGSAGLLAWFASQAAIAETYRETEYPKHK